jgi:deoxyribodipyrimidine photo-lyase
MREVHQALEARRKALAASPRTMSGNWPKAFSSFSSRLHWHCHFIQKLEDEPRIEFENMHPAYDKLRQEPVNEAYLTAWQQGQTGYPMVDACMRSLIATGWLNFRMRAMLMSFASYHLWLHWRLPALHLARQFTDYEPGIHYAQAQMQSGTTGINTIRIYNPIKQSLDQDPNGVFIKRWVPELRNMPVGFIHQPWLLPKKMNGYPMPIVEEKAARQAASTKLYALRKPRQHALAAQRIVDKHGSRKSGIIQIVPRRKPKKDPRQDEFLF